MNPWFVFQMILGIISRIWLLITQHVAVVLPYTAWLYTSPYKAVYCCSDLKLGCRVWASKHAALNVRSCKGKAGVGAKIAAFPFLYATAQQESVSVFIHIFPCQECEQLGIKTVPERGPFCGQGNGSITLMKCARVWQNAEVVRINLLYRQNFGRVHLFFSVMSESNHIARELR